MTRSAPRQATHPSRPRGHFSTDRAIAALVEDRAEPIAPRGRVILVVREGVDGRGCAVFGAPAAVEARRKRQSTVSCVVLLDPSPSLVEEALALENQRESTLAWSVKAATTLRRIGMSITDVADLLAISRGHAQRLVRFGLRPREIRDKALAGGITEGHLRYLGKLPDAAFARLVERVVTERLSVRELDKAMRQEALGISDDALRVELDAFAAKLSEALGAAVEIQWPADVTRRGVSVTWYTAEQLVGILSRLGGTYSSDPRAEKRTVFLSVRDTTETDALFGGLGLTL